MNGGITYSERTFSSPKINQSIKKMRMNPLTSFTTKITLDVQYDKKNNATHLQLMAIVLKNTSWRKNMHGFARNKRLKWIYFLWFGTIFVCAIACVCPDKRVSSVRDWRGGRGKGCVCCGGEGKVEKKLFLSLFSKIYYNKLLYWHLVHHLPASG